MKNLFITLAIFLFHIVTTSAQTKIIALKSHSGNIKELSLNGSDDFGKLAEDRLKRVTRLSDTSAEEVYGIPGSNDNDVQRIVYHHMFYNNPAISVDSLRRIYPGVWFFGFDKQAPIKMPKLQPIKKKFGLSIFFPFDNNDNNTSLFGLGIFIFTVVLAFIMWKNQQKRWRLLSVKN